MFRIVFSQRASGVLEALPSKWQKKVFSVVQSLKSNPYAGKKLQGQLAGLYSLRAWPYRIIYIVEKKCVRVVVVDIGHRKDIYR